MLCKFQLSSVSGNDLCCTKVIVIERKSLASIARGSEKRCSALVQFAHVRPDGFKMKE
jgi:hypothetical protein